MICVDKTNPIPDETDPDASRLRPLPSAEQSVLLESLSAFTIRLM